MAETLDRSRLLVGEVKLRLPASAASDLLARLRARAASLPWVARYPHLEVKLFVGELRGGDAPPPDVHTAAMLFAPPAGAAEEMPK